MKNPELSDEEFLYYLELEEVWKKSLPKLTNKEWLEVFPEAIEIIPEKIKEWTELRNDLKKRLKDKLISVKKASQNEFDYWFWREWFKSTILEKIVEAEKHISRLKDLLPKSKIKPPTNKLDKSEIDKARNIPIVNVVTRDSDLVKRGKNYFAICPFHKEKTPSFCIYPESNRFVCYGCNQKGDVIDYIMLTNNLNFREAVLWLLERY